MTFEDLNKVIARYMLLEDQYIVKLLCAYVVAIRMPIPPPWLVIIASSSGGKSTLLNALADVLGFYAMDDATPKAFLSGAKTIGSPASLLHQLNPNTFLVIKDFSTILSKEKESKKAIIGLLRKIYDGEMNRNTGTGERLEWEGKLGVLVGSTTSFHTKMREFADLGERFILYTFTQPNKRKVGEIILDEEIKDSEAKIAMRKAFQEYLDESVKVPLVQPKLDAETKNDLLDLADLTTKARSSVEREEYGQDHNIIAVHSEEQIGRFLKQLKGLAYGLIAINRSEGYSEGLLPADRKCLYAVALDSIPAGRRQILMTMAKYNDVTINRLGITLGLPVQTVKIAVEDLNAFHVITKAEGLGKTITYTLNEPWAGIIRKFEDIESTGKSLDDEEEYAPLPSEAGEAIPIMSFDEIIDSGQSLGI